RRRAFPCLHLAPQHRTRLGRFLSTGQSLVVLSPPVRQRLLALESPPARGRVVELSARSLAHGCRGALWSDLVCGRRSRVVLLALQTRRLSVAGLSGRRRVPRLHRSALVA